MKVFTIIVLVILVLNLVLFAFRLISPLVFWIIIIIGALVAYLVIPRLRKH